MNDIERLKYKDDEENVEIHLEVFLQFTIMLPWCFFTEVQRRQAINGMSCILMHETLYKKDFAHHNWDDAKILYNHNTLSMTTLITLT